MKILIAGEGGQGIQAIAEILAKASFYDGKHSTYIPNFGVEQRGGVSLAFVIINNEPIPYPKFEKAEILAILSDRSIERIQDYIGHETKIILSPSVTAMIDNSIKPDKKDYPTKSWNILVLGEINRQSNVVSKENLIKAMDERFVRQFTKNPELRDVDIRALNYA